MAGRVQRFLWDNLVQATASVLSASSTDGAFPLAWLRDQLPSKAWRSKLGWTIVAGFNDDIDFNRGGVKLATVAAGTYATGAALAAAIVTALEAADATPVWACSYDAGTNKFTVSSDLAFTLLFGTGANAATSIRRDIGFSGSDTASATSHTGGVATHQSRHWIGVDLASALAITAGIAHNHNAGTGGTFQLQSSATSILAAATVPAATQALSGNADLRLAFFASQSHRYLVLMIDDIGNSLGYAELGILFAGTYFQPGRAYVQGNRRQVDQLSEVSRALEGAFFLTPRRTPKRHAVLFRQLTRADRDSYQTMEDAVAGKHLFFALDPLNFPDTETLYGVILGTADIPQMVGDGSPPDRFDVPVTFVQDFG